MDVDIPGTWTVRLCSQGACCRDNRAADPRYANRSPAHRHRDRFHLDAGTYLSAAYGHAFALSYADKAPPANAYAGAVANARCKGPKSRGPGADSHVSLR